MTKYLRQFRTMQTPLYLHRRRVLPCREHPEESLTTIHWTKPARAHTRLGKLQRLLYTLAIKEQVTSTSPAYRQSPSELNKLKFFVIFFIAVTNPPTRKIGSVADIDPVNEDYGSLTPRTNNNHMQQVLPPPVNTANTGVSNCCDFFFLWFSNDCNLYPCFIFSEYIGRCMTTKLKIPTRSVSSTEIW